MVEMYKIDVADVYQKYIGHIFHENDLIAKRLGMFLTLNTLLATSVTFLIYSNHNNYLLNEFNSEHEQVVRNLITLISLGGVLISIIAFIGILGAVIALTNYEVKLSRFLSSVENNVCDGINMSLVFPSVRGGGSNWASMFGYIPPVFITSFSIGFWVIMAYFRDCPPLVCKYTTCLKWRFEQDAYLLCRSEGELSLLEGLMPYILCIIFSGVSVSLFIYYEHKELKEDGIEQKDKDPNFAENT